jgi:hypothetical protein
MQMGKVSAANVAQRLTYVLVTACERRLDIEIAELVATKVGAKWGALRAWRTEHPAIFDDDEAQVRVYFIDSYQDDIYCCVALTDETKVQGPQGAESLFEWMLAITIRNRVILIARTRRV